MNILMVYIIGLWIWIIFCALLPCCLDRLRLAQYADDESEVVDAEPITSHDEIDIKVKLTTNDIIC